MKLQGLRERWRQDNGSGCPTRGGTGKVRVAVGEA